MIINALYFAAQSSVQDAVNPPADGLYGPFSTTFPQAFPHPLLRNREEGISQKFCGVYGATPSMRRVFGANGPLVVGGGGLSRERHDVFQSGGDSADRPVGIGLKYW